VKVFLPIIFLFFYTDVIHLPDGRKHFTIKSREPINGIRIAWDYKTLKQLSPESANYSGYPRMIKLRDESLFCVYESDKSIRAIKSSDGGISWSEPNIIAVPENDVACAVPEVLQLQDGSIIVSYNLRPPRNNADPQKRFSIRVIKSLDGGQRWSNPVEVYRAGYEFDNGCWEPAQIQLPSGEIQLYIANEGPYTQSNEQEITMFRSIDQGQRWSKGEKMSFRSGHRDGMPVPLLLQNHNEIIVAIEDNGISGKEFKPAILHTSMTDSWSNAPVTGSNVAREYAMAATDSIPEEKYAGAPYVRQLRSGDVVLSYQGNERRSDSQWDRSDMIVSIGNSEGRNFNRKSFPFYISDPTKTALWNSVCVENDSTVIALSSTNAYGKTAVWMIKGYVLSEIKSPHRSDRAGVVGTEASKPHVFIGGYGSTQARINTAWDSDALYLTADVRDEKVFDASGDVSKDDAMGFYLDPRNLSLELPGENIFLIIVTAGGKCSYKQGRNHLWSEWSPSGIKAKSKTNDNGYRIELEVPWSALKYQPKLNQRIGFHAVVFETSTGRRHDYTEPLSGNITGAPYSWSPLYLTD
jgi:Carbohydrate family 9 binding domain-like/BNR repeat-like domain